jgi:error-prone DNA polymerase
MPLGEHVINDYRFLKLSLKAHPVGFLREELDRSGHVRCETLASLRSGAPLKLAGLVLVRQRPGTAKGVIFATLEDETGIANIIVWPKSFERYRPVVLGARFLSVAGRLQSAEGVIHIVAEHLTDFTPLLMRLADDGEKIEPFARCDAVKRPANPADRRANPARAAMPKGRNFH